MQFAISSLPCSEFQFSYAASPRLSRLRVSWPLDVQVKHWQLVTCSLAPTAVPAKAAHSCHVEAHWPPGSGPPVARDLVATAGPVVTHDASLAGLPVPTVTFTAGPDLTQARDMSRLDL